MSELDIYKEKLEHAEHKIRILEDLIENKSREIYKKNEDLITSFLHEAFRVVFQQQHHASDDLCSKQLHP